MPPRSVTAVILVFWLAVTGWCLYRTITPYLISGTPPPLVAAQDNQPIREITRWKLLKKERGKETDIGEAATELNWDGKGDWRMDCRYKINLQTNNALVPSLEVEVTNTYRLNRDKVLKDIRSHVSFSIQEHRDLFRAEVEAPVRDGELYATGKVQWPGGLQRFSVAPVRLPEQGYVLNPLHPVNRLTDLQPGRTWTVPLFDPMALAAGARLEGAVDPLAATVLAVVRSSFGQTKFTFLTAEVLPEGQALTWNGQAERCLLVKYRADELAAQTWVRESDGLVLQQEATFRGSTLVLQRLPPTADDQTPPRHQKLRP